MLNDGIKYCRYYTGDNNYQNINDDLRCRYAWFERHYFMNRGRNKEGREYWEKFSLQKDVMEAYQTREQLNDNNIPMEAKGFLVFTMADVMNMSPMDPTDWLAYYGMDKLIDILQEGKEIYKEKRIKLPQFHSIFGGQELYLSIEERPFNIQELYIILRNGISDSKYKYSLLYEDYWMYLYQEDETIARFQWAQRGEWYFYIRNFQALSKHKYPEEIEDKLLLALHDTCSMCVGEKYENIGLGYPRGNARLKKLLRTKNSERMELNRIYIECKHTLKKSNTETFRIEYFLSTGEGTYDFFPITMDDKLPLTYCITSVLTKRNIENFYKIQKKAITKDVAINPQITMTIDTILGKHTIEGTVEEYKHSPIVKAIAKFIKLKYSNYNAIFEEKDPIFRLFLMVSVLHSEGYQQLRLCTAIAPTGLSLRCWLTSKHNCCQDCGAMHTSDDPQKTVMLSNGLAYWVKDDVSAYDMAHAFIDEYPDLAKQCKRLDPDYVEWFNKALEECEQGHIMYSASDNDVCFRNGYIMLTGVSGRGLPFPPKGYSKGPSMEY